MMKNIQSDNQNNQWFLVRCKPKQEPRASINFANQSVTSYYPLVDVVKVRRGKKQVVREAIFPGYIFVYLDPSSILASKVKNTFGVYDYVRFAGKPQVVPDVLITDLKQRADQLVDESIPPGTEMLVNDGLYKNAKGIFLESDGEKRSILLIEMLSRPTKLTVDNKNILPLEC
ncbi:transcription/translation regulatory transformer protein RfaH [Vibrio hepatarius]|uniref:transcription/translation regulatory transformer protein RfaH n=1 Tax=Vibrio hepatarius TaxID=171383 RepID=UPI001C084133|nr:transcription/translation regulatory transformer protein RfaH [Vibrio hepatarius]MBU2896904.1 transcription/translation regulatory transformer protein RfaH [Vibrio hepatarius]